MTLNKINKWKYIFCILFFSKPTYAFVAVEDFVADLQRAGCWLAVVADRLAGFLKLQLQQIGTQIQTLTHATDAGLFSFSVIVVSLQCQAKARLPVADCQLYSNCQLQLSA